MDDFEKPKLESKYNWLSCRKIIIDRNEFDNSDNVV